MKITRHEFLVGLGGLAAGLPAGAVADRYGRRRFGPPSTGQMSFAQCGEDLIAGFIIAYLKLPKMTYLDVGAYDPVAINNTYYFYARGYRGVLVEPNVEMCKKLRAVRPGDTTLEPGSASRRCAKRTII